VWRWNERHGRTESEWLGFGTAALQSTLKDQTGRREQNRNQQGVVANDGQLTERDSLGLDAGPQHVWHRETWTERCTLETSAWSGHGQTRRCVHGSPLHVAHGRPGGRQTTAAVGPQHLGLSLPNLTHDCVVLLQLLSGNLSAHHPRRQTVWHPKRHLILAIVYFDHAHGVVQQTNGKVEQSKPSCFILELGNHWLGYDSIDVPLYGLVEIDFALSTLELPNPQRWQSIWYPYSS